ncbi:MAG: hypothetical protein H6510_09825 [Acidobacteria bacterium]|nr:hypothetical protein [Acidobacteriota bacterium]
MFLFLKFVHLISAMVLLGLPLAFTRMKRVLVRVTDPAIFQAGIQQIRGLFHYLHLAMVLLLLTGMGMFHFMGRVPALFSGIAIGALIVLWGNMFMMDKTLKKAQNAGHFPKSFKAFAVFSIIHHSLVTGLTALMVFKPFY